ncbi:YceD family protein [Sphingobacterium sp. HJSM2_6]|uniref:YceD family protein n=1 Tax=Sphingobacterium sp. HJSM2_6 TaxID=3366264 RepID=UPI003BD1ECA6
MKYLKKYRIPFSGLTTGKHSFDFDVDDQFFACYEHSLVKQGKLLATVYLQKQENMLITNFDIQGEILLTCDTCLSDFHSPVEIKERALVKFTDEDWTNETDEVIVLSKKDYELDIAPLLYEYINLAVPAFAKCSLQGGLECDPEMLSMIQQEQEDDSSTEEKEQIDPRWDALKKIKNN